MTSEEEKLKADINQAQAALHLELAKATGMVKPHMVWIAGGIGALLGFILAHVVQ